jgi:hypothetical protein
VAAMRSHAPDLSRSKSATGAGRTSTAAAARDPAGVCTPITAIPVNCPETIAGLLSR